MINPMTTTQPRRRFFRYSLRTLMLVVTVFCIGLGSIGIQIKQARHQRQAVEAILATGGIILYEYQRTNSDPPGPEWLRRIIGDEYFFTIGYVDFSGSKVNNASLAAVVNFLASVKYLSLFSTEVTDEGLENLKELTNLRIVHIISTKITDEGMKDLHQALPNCMMVHTDRDGSRKILPPATSSHKPLK